MDFLPSGLRTLKRHSIATLSDAIRSRLQNRASELPLKNREFISVSAAIVQLFQKKKLQENELTSLQQAVRNLMATEAGPLISEYYKDKLILKGMETMKENLKHKTGQTLLTVLGEHWDYFYGEILPVLQALLYPINTKSVTIKHVALLEFRNTVLLKLPVKDAFEKLSKSDPISPAIQQMLLVLHGVHEYPCTDNSIELEKLVARVTSPHLGIMGLYSGGSEPEIRSSFMPPGRIPFPVINIPDETTESDDEIMPIVQISKKTSLLSLNRKQKSRRLFYDPVPATVQGRNRLKFRRNSVF